MYYSGNGRAPASGTGLIFNKGALSSSKDVENTKRSISQQ